MNDRLKERIISAAYGDSSIAERFSIWILIRRNPEYKKLFDEYRRTAKSVHKIKLEECPEEIINTAFEKVDDEIERSGKSSTAKLFANPLLAGAVAVILLISVVITFNETSSRKEKQYSKTEVLHAEKQVKSSLAIIGKLLNQTTKKLEEEILPQKVGKPIQQGFEIINQLFPKGAKQDENS